MITEIVTMLAQITPDVAQLTPEMAKLTSLNGSFTLGVAAAGAGIGVGLVGLGATQAVGRNPGAKADIMTIAILSMALAEACAIYALVLAFMGR
jgi:F-type H+-transporting ATPase subunit c